MKDESFAQLLASADSVEITSASPTMSSASKSVLQRSAATLAIALISSTFATVSQDAVAAQPIASTDHNLVHFQVDGQERSYLSVGKGIEMVKRAAKEKGLATGWEGLHYAINEATGFATHDIAKCMPRAKSIEEAVSNFADEFKSAEDWARQKGSQTSVEYASAITAYNHANMSACTKWNPADIIQFSDKAALKVQLKSTTLLASFIRDNVPRPVKPSSAKTLANYPGFQQSLQVEPDYRRAGAGIGVDEADISAMYTKQIDGTSVYLYDSKQVAAYAWLNPKQPSRILLTTGFINKLSSYIGDDQRSHQLALDSTMDHELGHVNNHQSLGRFINKTSDKEFAALTLRAENVADATAAVSLLNKGYSVNDLKKLHIAMDMMDAGYSVASASRSVVASYISNNQQILHELSLSTSPQDARQRMTALAQSNQESFEQLASSIDNDSQVSAMPVYIADALQVPAHTP